MLTTVLNKKVIILPILLGFIVVGCGQTTENLTTDSTSTETVKAEPEKKDPASLLVGNWKILLDQESLSEGLSEEQKEYMDRMMSNFEFIIKFTADGKYIVSGEEEVANYTVEGDRIFVNGESLKFTVSESELTIDNDGEMMKFARTDQDVSSVADIQSRIESQLGGSIEESEAKTYVGAINRGQQAYFLENSDFANTIEDLQLGLEAETEDYKYSITTKETASFQYAMAKSEEIKSFVGGVFLVSDGETDYITTNAGLCVADAPGMTQLGEPSVQDNEIVCPDGTTKVE